MAEPQFLDVVPSPGSGPCVPDACVGVARGLGWARMFGVYEGLVGFGGEGSYALDFGVGLGFV